MAETKVSRDLLDAVSRRAAAEGRDEAEVVEEALKRYLAVNAGIALEADGSFDAIFARVREWQERRGVEPLSDEEAMKLAVEEQHAHRGEAGGG